MWYMQPSNRGGWPKGWCSKRGGSKVSAHIRLPPGYRKVRMSETNDTRGGRAPLSLKKTETSTVKQSFSHGRTKAVVVEKKRARVMPGGAPEPSEKPKVAAVSET